MATYLSTVLWTRNGETFTDHRYSRRHRWRFDGGVEVPASSSPHVVPVPFSEVHAVDPEEAFVASLSSCHMLWFLSLAAKRGLVVEAYEDHAVGTLDKNEDGRPAMTEVRLRPRVTFAGAHQPETPVVHELHHAAHEACFIANSVRTQVLCEPVFPPAATDPGASPAG